MNEKPMKVTEMARMGGLARAKAHSKAELRAWGKQGGRPGRLDREALARLRRLLASGKSEAECAAMRGVSLRTLGRGSGPNEDARENRWGTVVSSRNSYQGQ
jgi:DNA invertase Pin-like site-specific DNA recombinase